MSPHISKRRAKVRGTRVFPTEGGKKSGLVLRQPKGMTVFELDGHTAFEAYHQSGDAFRMHTELRAPNGFFVKAADLALDLTNKQGNTLKAGGIIMQGNCFSATQINILLRSDGSCSFGVNRSPR
ncbi:MAG: hypothetical protein ACYDDO_02500 [Acidiferrobacterales bacterium]